MNNQKFDIKTTGKIIKIARLANEWYDFIIQPDSFIEGLRNTNPKPDLFTFLQEPDEVDKKYNYYSETDSISILPISTYDDWMKNQIDAKTRNMVRKAGKCGLELRVTDMDEVFIKSVVDIYNESPFRQGKKFWHYGIDFEGTKAHLETYFDRSQFVGVYDGDQMIGFFKLTKNANSASVMQIISKISERNKAPNNALLAKAVEMCAEQGIPFLQYGIWSEGGLGAYKIKHGFKRFEIPRYYVPMTLNGKLALKLKLYRKPTEMLPPNLYRKLKSIRQAWVDRETAKHSNREG